MSTVLLVRQPVELDSDRELLERLDSCTNLADEAKELLGYHPGVCERTKLMGETQSRVSLKQAMQELCVDPFSSTSVQAYQNRMRNRGTPIVSRILVSCWPRVEFLLEWGFYGGCIAVLAGIVSGICSKIGYEAFMTLGQTGIGFLVAAICLIFVVSTANLLKVKVAEWRSILISEYAGLIPDFALQTAVDLKRKCPGIELSVEELRFKNVVLDPFLVAKDAGGTKYYLEVWNEPGFIQNRSV